MKIEFKEIEVQRAVSMMIEKDFGIVVDPSEIKIRNDYSRTAAEWEGEYVGKTTSTESEKTASEAE